jgi:SAM-dependent methyltransferase
MASDQKTADAFANSWNNLPSGSVYTRTQFEDWFAPLGERDICAKRVLELGCGNGSLLVHVAGWNPAYLEGVDLGPSVMSANANMQKLSFRQWRVTQADMTTFTGKDFDLVYSIGVLHHLKNPKCGLDAVLRNVKPGGRFHCWVYAREGNTVVIRVIDPIRKAASRFPWWITKYFIATPLAFPYFLYAKLLYRLRDRKFVKQLPLHDYSLWIAERDFSFFRHVAFDQLVTPQTTYISKETIEHWLNGYDCLDKNSVYIIMRNGNSWKFGGKIK